MAEIDPVILQLRAEMLAYKSELRNTTSLAVTSFAKQEAGVRHLEAQMRRSSGQISTAFKGLAGTLAAGFSLKSVSNLADQYTKFTNQLKVAGLEGRRLGETQEDLFGIAQRYGAELESVGTLYGRLSGSTKELGLSNAELLQFVEGTAAALKVSGQTAGESAGALLQLSQALGGTNIQAEEYNSLIDGARPLLQAVANGSDRFAGSVAKLTAQVKDGKVSVQDFVAAGLKGIPDLINQSEKANLTIGASFTVLNNALGKYVGQTDASLSATQRISQAISLLADNLDTIIPALTALVAFLGVRYVVAAGKTTAATIAKSAADVRATLTAEALAAATAQLSGLMLGQAAAATTAAASVTRLGVVGGVASRGMAGFIALLGGPVVATVLAVSAAIYVLQSRLEGAAVSSAEYANRLKETAAASDKAREIIDRLATATGRERVESLAAAKAARALAASHAEAAVQALRRAQAELELAKTTNKIGAGGGAGQAVKAILGINPIGAAQANVDAAGSTVLDLDRRIKELDKAIGAAAYKPGSAGGDPKKKTGGASGPTAAEIQQRHNQEMARYDQEEIQARIQITADAEERASLQRELLNAEYNERRAQIENDQNFTKAQKAAQIAALERLYGNPNNPTAGDGSNVLGEAVTIEERRRLADEARSRADNQSRIEQDLLEASARLAESRIERRDIELELLDKAYDDERRALKDQESDQTISQSKRDEATLRLSILDKLRALDREGVERDFESPLARYRRQVEQTKKNMGDEIEQSQVDAIERLNDSLTDTISNYVKLGGIAGDVINGIIRDLIRLSVQQAVVGLIGDGKGGGLFQKVGSALGFASGGYTGNGDPKDVAGVVHKREFVMPAAAVDRIGVANLEAMANGRAAAAMGNTRAAMPAASQPGIVRLVIEEAPGFATRVRTISTDQAIEVTRQAAPQLIDASVNETFRRGARPSI